MSADLGSSRVAYVIATFAGRPGDIVSRHLESLSRLKHNLARVMVVSGGGAPLCSIPSGVELITRPNVGYSYASWWHAFLKYRTDYTHYIFMEDDYIYTQDHFDRTMVELLPPRSGMLCGHACGGQGLKHMHAGIALGMCPTEALLAAETCGLPPYNEASDYINGGCGSQRAWGEALGEGGWPVTDWKAHYSTAFYVALDGRITWFDDLEKKSFVIPIQTIGKTTRIHTTSGIFQGELLLDGTVANKALIDDSWLRK